MIRKLLADIALALDSARIPYMVIGGQAVLVYGEPRMTRDIDITLGVDDSSSKILLEIGESLHLHIAVKDVEAFIKKTNVLPLYDSNSGFRVDFIFSFSPYEKEALARTRSIEIEGRQIKYASVEDVIIHKLVAGRPRDCEDVKGIILRQQSSIDLPYVHRWLKQFSESLGKNLVADFEKLI